MLTLKTNILRFNQLRKLNSQTRKYEVANPASQNQLVRINKGYIVKCDISSKTQVLDA